MYSKLGRSASEQPTEMANSSCGVASNVVAVLILSLCGPF